MINSSLSFVSPAQCAGSLGASCGLQDLDPWVPGGLDLHFHGRRKLAGEKRQPRSPRVWQSAGMKTVVVRDALSRRVLT